MKQYLLPENIGQAVMNYLAQRPYAEVFHFVSALQALKEAPQPEEEAVKPDLKKD